MKIDIAPDVSINVDSAVKLRPAMTRGGIPIKIQSCYDKIIIDCGCYTTCKDLRKMIEYDIFKDRDVIHSCDLIRQVKKSNSDYSF